VPASLLSQKLTVTVPGQDRLEQRHLDLGRVTVAAARPEGDESAGHIRYAKVADPQGLPALVARLDVRERPAARVPPLTKVGHAAGWSRDDWRPPAILKSIERSLERLRTDALDLVQLHSCSEGVLKKGDAVTAWRRRQRGLTRYIGYSGDGAAAVWRSRAAASTPCESP